VQNNRRRRFLGKAGRRFLSMALRKSKKESRESAVGKILKNESDGNGHMVM
jgi:hypothetical protein